jgi:hypothetical protein
MQVVAMGIVAVGIETVRCGSPLAIANKTQLSSPCRRFYIYVIVCIFQLFEKFILTNVWLPYSHKMAECGLARHEGQNMVLF